MRSYGKLAGLAITVICLFTAPVRAQDFEFYPLDKDVTYSGQVTPTPLPTPLRYAPYGPVEFSSTVEVGMKIKQNGRLSPLHPMLSSGTVSIRKLTHNMAYGIRMQTYSVNGQHFDFDLAAAIEVHEDGTLVGQPRVRVVKNSNKEVQKVVEDTIRQMLTGLNRFPEQAVAPGADLMPYADNQIARLQGQGATGSMSCLYKGLTSHGNRQGAYCRIKGEATVQGKTVDFSGYNIFDLQTGAALKTEIRIDGRPDSGLPEIYSGFEITTPQLM